MFFQVGDFHMNIGSLHENPKTRFDSFVSGFNKISKAGSSYDGWYQDTKETFSRLAGGGHLWMMFAPNMYSTFIDLKLSVLGKLLGILFLLLQESRFALVARVKHARTQ